MYVSQSTFLYDFLIFFMSLRKGVEGFIPSKREIAQTGGITVKSDLMSDHNLLIFIPSALQQCKKGSQAVKFALAYPFEVPYVT